MTARVIHLAVARPASASSSNLSSFFDSAPFMSMCPACSEPRLQLGYTRWSLLRRLNGDRAIEACCVTCDQFWPVTTEERVALAKELEHLRVS
jgi:hypothetical protein